MLDRFKGLIRALTVSFFAGGVLAAISYATAQSPAPTRRNDADGGQVAERSLCEAHFVAPLKAYSELRLVKEWEENGEKKEKDKEKEPTKIVVVCEHGCGDAGADGGTKKGSEAGAVTEASANTEPDARVAAPPRHRDVKRYCQRIVDSNHQPIRAPDDAGAASDVDVAGVTTDGARQGNGAEDGGWYQAEQHSTSPLGSTTYAGDLEKFKETINNQGGSIEVIIATLADPTDSGLRYYFDQQIEALQLAIERSGHTRDQSWIPWADTHAPDDKARSASEACRRDVPGVIVFRPRDPAYEPVILLLLVGETPTFGVQKAALARAIDIHRSLTAVPDGERRIRAPAPLRVVGPSFSGGAASLRQAIDQEWDCDARIISGSATSRRSAEIMRAPYPKNRSNDFEITTIAEDELRCAFLRRESRLEWWLDELEPGEERVVRGFAMLRESGTSFGFETRQKPLPASEKEKNKEKDEASPAPTPTGSSGAQTPPPKGGQRKTTPSRFPKKPPLGKTEGLSDEKKKADIAPPIVPQADAGALNLDAGDYDAGGPPPPRKPEGDAAPPQPKGKPKALFGAPRSSLLSSISIGQDPPPTEAPTSTKSSEQDETSCSAEFCCPYRSDLDLLFPLHISSVRDAYENRDEERARAHHPEAAIPARQTTLDPALQEHAKPRDIQFETSVKTPIARDLVLSQLLGAIARENIRTVGIQATDSADVIFLARKIRDVAPDVRLVIFGSDVLYTHPSYRTDLLGSYVVTPYPFFGSNDFARGLSDAPESRHWWDWLWFTPEGKKAPETPEHIPFAGALSEGVFNATLAVQRRRGQSALEGPPHFSEYNFFRRKEDGAPEPPPLPIWIGAIGSGGIAPVAVRRPLNCGGLIHGRPPPTKEEEEACRSGRLPPELRKQLALGQYVLRVEPDVTPPNFWQFVFTLVIFIAFLDAIHGRAARRSMKMSAQRPTSGECDDRWLDLTLLRTKYLFYAAVRRQILFAALLTMLVIQSLAIATYGDQLVSRKFPIVLLLVGMIATGISGYGVYSSWRRHLRRRRELKRELKRLQHEDESPEEPKAIPKLVRQIWRPLARILGFSPTSSAPTVISHTLNQLRLLGIVVVVVSIPLIFYFLKAVEQLDPEPLSVIAIGRATNPNVAMFVLRALPLVSHVSPAAPILIGLLTCYLWATGRSGRLRTLFRVSLMTPSAGALHACCTPITHILHGQGDKEERDAMRLTEKALSDAITRPSHTPIFFFAMSALIFLPVVAFTLKPPRTLEGVELNGVLVTLLAVSAIVIATTLIQLGLYWRAFSRLLDRIQLHAIAESFDNIPSPLKESLDSQVSRRKDDGHRFAACVRRFGELHDAQKGVVTNLPGPFVEVDWHNRLVEMERALAKVQAPRGWSPFETDDGGVMGRLLVEAAVDLRAGLEKIWHGQWGQAQIGVVKAAKEDAGDHERADAMTRFDALEDKATVAWLRRAHSFVAGVVTLFINRHIRQFRIFLYTSTAAALCLLASLSSYVFQPRRLFLTCIWVIMGSVVFGCVYVYIQLDRNTILSRISATKPERLQIDAPFVARVLGWVGLPLLSVAAAQYPEVASKLFSWMEPFLNALK